MTIKGDNKMITLLELTSFQKNNLLNISLRLNNDYTLHIEAIEKIMWAINLQRQNKLTDKDVLITFNYQNGSLGIFVEGNN